MDFEEENIQEEFEVFLERFEDRYLSYEEDLKLYFEKYEELLQLIETEQKVISTESKFNLIKVFSIITHSLKTLVHLYIFQVNFG